MGYNLWIRKYQSKYSNDALFPPNLFLAIDEMNLMLKTDWWDSCLVGLYNTRMNDTVLFLDDAGWKNYWCFYVQRH